MSPRPESTILDINGRKIAAIRHRDPEIDQPLRMLCLHGWLDNANSFVPLMPFLPSIDLVAIDLPGHGHSDHLDGGYSITDMTWWTLAVLQALDWQQCHLLGHSLGACIAPVVAVANPGVIETLTMIDASGPLSETPMLLPARLKQSMQDRFQSEKFASRTFASKELAVAARLKATTMEMSSARLIVDRQLESTQDGYRWQFDPRLRMTSPQYQTEEQVLAILGAVECPTLTILAENGFLAGRRNTESRLGRLQRRETITLAGNHHFHMDSPEPVAAAINRFLGTRPALGG
ncbi:MAG: alpha/beta hydrolase [Granulosicoccus sp.]